MRKNLFIRFGLLAGLTFLMGGCEDLFPKPETGSLTVQVAWSDNTVPREVGSLVFTIEGEGIDPATRIFEPTKAQIEVTNLAIGNKLVVLEGKKDINGQGNALYRGSGSVTIEKDSTPPPITVTLTTTGGVTPTPITPTTLSAILKGVVNGAAGTLKPKPGHRKTSYAVKGVPDATVLVFDLDSASSSAVATGTTDASGSYSVTLDMSKVGKGDGKGTMATYAVWIDKSVSPPKVKVASLDDIAMDVTKEGGSVKDLSKEGKDMTVEEDKVKPTVLSIMDDNAPDTGISDGDPDPLFEPSKIPFNSKIVIVFSESIEHAAFQNGALELYSAMVTNADAATGQGGTWKKGAKVASSSDANSVVTFNGKRKEFRWEPPAGVLLANKDYILEVKVGVDKGAADSDCLTTDAEASCLYVEDPAKNKIADNSNKDFKDNDNTAVTARIHTVDVVTFKVGSSKPDDKATGVSIYDPISLTFSAPVDFVTLKSNIKSSPQLPEGRVETNANTVTYFPSSGLTPNTSYTITVGANTANLSGDKLGKDFALTFTTGADVLATVTTGDADKTTIVRGIERAINAFESGDFNTFASVFAVDFVPAFEDPFTGKFNFDYDLDGNEGTPEDAEAWFEDRKEDMSERNQRGEGFTEIERVPVKSGAKRAAVEHFKNANGIELYHGWVPLLPGIDFVEVKTTVKDPFYGYEFEEFRMYEVACNPALENCASHTESQITATWEDCEPPPGVDNDNDGEINEDWQDGIDNDNDSKIDEDDWCNKTTGLVFVVDGDDDATNSWATNNELGPDGQPLWGDNDKDGDFDEDGYIVVISTDAKRHSNAHANGDTECIAFGPFGDPCVFGTKVKYVSSITAAIAEAATAGKDYAGIDNDGDAVRLDNQSHVFDWGRVDEDWPDGVDNDPGACTFDPITQKPTCLSPGDGLIDEDSDGGGDDAWPRDGDADPKNDPMTWENQNAFWSNSELYLVPASVGGDISDNWMSEDGTVSFGELRGPRGWPNIYQSDWSKCFKSDGSYDDSGCRPDKIDFNEDGDWNSNTTDTSNTKPQIRRVPNVPGTVAASDLNGDGVIDDIDDFLSVGWDAWQYGVTFDLKIIDPAVYSGHPADHKIIDVEPSWLVMEGDDDNDGKINEDGKLQDYLDGKNTASLDTNCNSSTAQTVARTATLAELATAVADYGCDFSDGIDNDGDGDVDEVESFDDDWDGQVDEDPVDDTDNDKDGRVDEDPANFEVDRVEDFDLWEQVFSETTDAVTLFFTVESDLTAEYKKVSIGATLVLRDIDDFPLFTDANHGFAGVVLTETVTFSPHNPFCQPFDPETREAQKCEDTETFSFALKFDLEKINGGWFVIAMAGPEPEHLEEAYAEGGALAGGGGAPSPVVGANLVAKKPSLASPPTGPRTVTVLDLVAQSPRYSGRRHASH